MDPFSFDDKGPIVDNRGTSFIEMCAQRAPPCVDANIGQRSVLEVSKLPLGFT